jgi:hypothetical protein
MAIDGHRLDTWEAPAGFFLRLLDLPAGALAGHGPWARLTIRSSPVSGEAPIPTAIEQFNAQPPDTLMWGFDAGWNEAEYSPALGIWHWSSDRSSLRIVGATSDVRVMLDVESPRRYFAGPSQVRAVVGNVEVASATVGQTETWSFEIPRTALDASGGIVVLETSQTFVPAERDGNADRRRLGLRVFDLRVDRAGLR